jgi:hypothetical protein
MNAVLAVAMVLLAESFGRDVVWQWRQRRIPAPPRIETASLVVAGSE